jgi:hypothetical protein
LKQSALATRNSPRGDVFHRPPHRVEGHTVESPAQRVAITALLADGGATVADLRLIARRPPIVFAKPT